MILDITKPLCRFQNIKGRDGRVVKVTFACERLPLLCFLCGVIIHSKKACYNVNDDEQLTTLGWSKAHRATPRKRAHKLMNEVEDIKACRKILFVPKTTYKEDIS